MSASAPLLTTNPTTDEEVDFHPTYSHDKVLEWLESVLDPVTAPEIEDDEDGEEAFMTLFECDAFKLKNGETTPFFSKAGVLLWRPNKNYELDGYFTSKLPVQYAAEVDIDFDGKVHYWATPYTTTGEDGSPEALTSFNVWGVISKESVDLYSDSDNFRNTIKDIIGSGKGGRCLSLPEEELDESPVAESSDAKPAEN